MNSATTQQWRTTMLTRTINETIKNEDRTVDLQITEFSYWTCLNLLKKYFLGIILPMLEESRNNNEEIEISIDGLLNMFFGKTDDEAVIVEFSKEFLQRVKYRVGSGDWKNLSDEEELDIETALVAVKKVAEINLKSFSRAASLLGYGDLVASLKEQAQDLLNPEETNQE
jgi:hypothetical protein